MKITIYTTNTCAYCAMVKRYLDGKNLPYEVVNLDEQPDRRQEAYKLSGALTVPITTVTTYNEDNGPGWGTQEYSSMSVIVGWNPSKLAAAIS